MKKKLLVLVLALVMMVTAAMPAFAADVLTTKGTSHAGLQSTASVDRVTAVPEIVKW